MIGVYDYTVIATYLSLLLGLAGIYLSSCGNVPAAILCLMIAGLLDAFDGRIARTKKDRTDTEKRFGIQIDSLNDLVCFGVLPAAIGAGTGVRAVWFLAVMALFPLCALIRLAYFNVLEEERGQGADTGRRYYLGVPVTSAAFMIPAYFLLGVYGGHPELAYGIGLAVLGAAFITPVHVPKPGLKGILVMALIGLAEVALFILASMGL